MQQGFLQFVWINCGWWGVAGLLGWFVLQAKLMMWVMRRAQRRVMMLHRYVYHGRVQGVGFRWTTRRIARHLPVTGFVRNQPDGTVELVVDGDRDVIARFLTEIDAAFPGHVDEREETAAPDESFTKFDIRQ